MERYLLCRRGASSLSGRDPCCLCGYVGSLRQVRALVADVVSGRTCENAARSSHRYIHIRPEVVGWAPRCDLAPLTTSFGTVALRERQHLAMADTTFHSKPPRTVLHVPTTTFHTAVFWQKSTYGPVDC